MQSPSGSGKRGLSVVLPTYNEAANILPLLRRVGAVLAHRDHEIIVVDDESPDGTADRADAYAAGHPEVRVVRRRGERGLTGALNRGIRESRKDRVAWMDADLSHPPELLDAMLREMRTGGRDAVVASRFVAGGADERRGAYRLQRLLSRTLAVLAAAVTRLPVLDVTSGYIVIDRRCLRRALPLEGDYGEYFIALMHRLGREGCRVAEIPYAFENRRFGESKTATTAAGYAVRGCRYLKMIFACRT